MYEVWIRMLIAGNGFVLLIFGIGQIAIKNKRPVTYWSIAFFTYTAAVLIYSAAVRSSSYRNVPIVIWLDIPIVTIIGPLLFFYFTRLVNPEYRFSWKERWLFIPTMISILATPIVGFMDMNRVNPIVDWLSNASLLWVIFCCALFIFRGYTALKGSMPEDSRRIRFLLGISFCVIAVGTAFFVIVLAGAPNEPIVFVLTLFFVAIYVYHLRHPELLSGSAGHVQARYSGRSRLEGIDLNSVFDLLSRTMEKDKPYLREDLTLSELADKVGLSHHQLSEILNKEMKTTFKAYINNHRLREARRILRERPGMTVIQAAFECGFRSKSAFNKLFHEDTGLTPTEYRRRG